MSPLLDREMLDLFEALTDDKSRMALWSASESFEYEASGKIFATQIAKLKLAELNIASYL